MKSGRINNLITAWCCTYEPPGNQSSSTLDLSEQILRRKNGEIELNCVKTLVLFHLEKFLRMISGYSFLVFGGIPNFRAEVREIISLLLFYSAPYQDWH